jgi:hypothetical protein
MTSHCNSLILNLNDHYSDYPKYFKKIYDKNCLTKKKIYIEWIDLISKKKEDDIFWWSLEHVSKNNYLNKIFHYFVIIESLNELKNTKKFNHIIIDDIVKNNINKIKFRYKKKIIFQQTKKRKKKFFQIFKFIFYEFLSILILKISKKNYYKDKVILIDCFITNCKDCETFIMKKMKKNFGGKKSIFVPTYSYMGYFKRLYLNMKLSNKNNYLIKENFLHLVDIFDLFKVLKYAFFNKEKLDNLKNWNFEKIVRSEMRNFTQYESIFISILNYNFIKRIREKSLNVSKSINYFENQNLDKGWNLGFKKFYKKEICFGYQAFNYLPEAFNIAPSKLEYDQGVCPNTIIIKAKGFKKIISENCRKFKFQLSSSFKKFRVLNKKKIIDYLFISTGIQEEDKKLIDTIMIFKQHELKKKIGIKFHPISKISSKIIETLNNKKIRIFKGNINECIEISDSVVSTGLSTSLLEALINNCKVIVVSNSIYDKIFFKDLNIPKKSYIFLKKIEHLKNIKLSNLNQNERKKLVANFF